MHITTTRYIRSRPPAGCTEHTAATTTVSPHPTGYRIGKGEGYADLEYAMARGAGAVTEDTMVVTTVHDDQARNGGGGRGCRSRLLGAPGIVVDRCCVGSF